MVHWRISDIKNILTFSQNTSPPSRFACFISTYLSYLDPYSSRCVIIGKRTHVNDLPALTSYHNYTDGYKQGFTGFPQHAISAPHAVLQIPSGAEICSDYKPA